MDVFRVYIRDIENSRFFSREEEHDLAVRAKAGDANAREALIRSLLPFVVTIAERDTLIRVPRYLMNPNNVDAEHVTAEEREHFAALRSAPLVLEHPVPARESEERVEESELAELRRNLGKLPKRMREIIRRRMNGEKLVDVAKVLGITRERVRQLEGAAIRKLLRLYGVTGRTFTMTEAMR